MVDRDEITESPREPLSLDRRRLVSTLSPRPHNDFLVLTAFFRWKQGNEGIVERGLFRSLKDLLRGAMRDNLAIVHRSKPIEPARLIHVRRCNNYAHEGPAQADRIDQLPELPTRERIDARRRLIE